MFVMQVLGSYSGWGLWLTCRCLLCVYTLCDKGLFV